MIKIKSHIFSLILLLSLKPNFSISMQLKKEVKQRKEEREVEINNVLKKFSLPEVLVKIIYEYTQFTETECKKLNKKLIKAFGENNLVIIKELISRGIQVNVYINAFGTPLEWCIQQGRWEIFELLLNLGVDPDLNDNSEKGILDLANTALECWAAPNDNGKTVNGRQRIVKILQEYQKKQEARKKEEDRQKNLNLKLIKVMEENDLAKIKQLISAGAQINTSIHEYGRPLEWCLKEGHWEAFEFLLDLEADPYLEIEGKSIYAMASEDLWSWPVNNKNQEKTMNGRKIIVEILKEYQRKQEYRKNKRIIIEDYFV